MLLELMFCVPLCCRDDTEVDGDGLRGLHAQPEEDHEEGVPIHVHGAQRRLETAAGAVRSQAQVREEDLRLHGGLKVRHHDRQAVMNSLAIAKNHAIRLSFHHCKYLSC